ncbi:MAG: hypothetical protein KJT01_02905 [Gemmatimonadetes bacterium]|nr:hypothetical protein [Gemmatimonadota bacterium]
MSRWLLLGVLLAPTLIVEARPAVAQAAARDGEPSGVSATSRILVVRVAVPSGVRAAAAAQGASIWWRATAGPGVRLLGADSGRVAAGDSVLRLTLQRSPTVRGGRHLGATVRMGVAESDGLRRLSPLQSEGPQGDAGTTPVQTVRVPLEVPVRRHMVVDTAPGGARAVLRGHWNALPLAVANRGNITETGRLVVSLPTGWRIAGAPGWDSLMVYPGEDAVRAPRLWVPEGWAAGQQALTVRWQATARDPRGAESDSQRVLRLEVQDGPSANPGPRLEVTTMGIRTGDGSSAVGGAVSLAGPLVGDLTVDARLAMGGTRNPGASWGLARGGVVTAPPVVTLASPRGALTLGTVQGTGALLAGAFLTGVGGAAHWTPSGHRLQVYGARPFAFAAGRPLQAGTGQLVGGALERQWNAARVGVEGAHLRDPLARRALDAAVVSGAVAPTGRGEFEGALGWRRYASGAGAGAQGSYRRVGAASTVELRAVHAPGGSVAFARAARELSLSASRQLGGRTTVAGGGWHQGDDGGVLGRLRSDGWYLMPSMALRSRSVLASLELRGASLRTVGSGGALANDERQVTALVAAQRGRMSLGVRAGVALVRRAVGVDALPLVAATARRAEWRATVGSWLPGGGRMEGSWTEQLGTGDPQLVPRQRALTARVDRLPVPGLSTVPLTLEGDAQWLATAGAASVWMARGGVRLPLPSGGALILQAERVPFLATRGARGLVYAVRVEQRAGLPRFGAGRSHVAFVDANDNGRRDPGESGVPGVVVRCGSAGVRAVSDAMGRVRCPVGDDIEVDARALPSGYLAPRRDTRATARSAEPLALRPVRVLVVQLVPLEADTFRLKPADLARAMVTLRDQGTPRWTARSLGDGRFVFDALPPGTYQPEVDLLDIAEPLQLAAPLAPVTISADRATPPVVVSLRARPLRLVPPGNASPGSAPGRARTGSARTAGAAP